MRLTLLRAISELENRLSLSPVNSLTPERRNEFFLLFERKLELDAKLRDLKACVRACVRVCVPGASGTASARRSVRSPRTCTLADARGTHR
jgi:hypothetical protein